MSRLTVGARFQALLQIHREIAGGNYPNATDLGKKLGIVPKTARKYIRQLADTFGVQPIYHDIRHGFYYETPSAAQLVPRLREEEVVAYFLLEEASRNLTGSPVQPVLDSVLKKMALMLPGGTELTFDDLSSALSLRMERAVSMPASAMTINTLYRGLTTQRSVKIRYEGRQRQASTARLIDPLHLTRCEGQWYLIAYCHLRKDIRTFVPARMKDVKITNQKFERPKNFDPRQHFKTAFGVVAGVDVTHVTLRFDAEAAPAIRERIWHATQILEEQDDGGVKMKLTCSQSVELLSWLLSWGDQVVVEAPAALRKKVKDAHQKAAAAQK
jgi:predicted DNA-binding transcriptional regulator YafY